MPESVPFGVANKTVVFDLLDELRRAWETILNEYARTHSLGTQRGGVRYLDGWLACHNFFKLALDHLVEEAGLTGRAAAMVFLAAGDTFDMAMKARAAQALLAEGASRAPGSGDGQS